MPMNRVQFQPGLSMFEYAFLVDKDRAGANLFEGHGAPATSGTVKPGPKKDVHQELMSAYNPHARHALSITAHVDRSEPGAAEELAVRYPQVQVFGGH